MRGSWMRDELEKIMSPWMAKEGCGPQDTLRDILTDLRHIAQDGDLDFGAAVEGSGDVFAEELLEKSRNGSR